MANENNKFVVPFSLVSFPTNQWGQGGGLGSPRIGKPHGTTNELEKGWTPTIFMEAFLPSPSPPSRVTGFLQINFSTSLSIH